MADFLAWMRSNFNFLIKVWVQTVFWAKVVQKFRVPLKSYYLPIYSTYVNNATSCIVMPEHLRRFTRSMTIFPANFSTNWLIDLSFSEDGNILDSKSPDGADDDGKKVFNLIFDNQVKEGPELPPQNGAHTILPGQQETHYPDAMGKKLSSSVKSKTKKPTSEGHVCNICGKIYQKSHSLKTHIAVFHHQEKKFSCDKCDKVFGRNDGLKRHMLTHTLEKRYICEFCNRLFNQSSNLIKHR